LGQEVKPSSADQNPASTGFESTKGNPRKNRRLRLWRMFTGLFFRHSPTAAIPAVTCNFMTTYLTKIINGKTYHFRSTVDKNCVDIVHGIFYNRLEKYFEGCSDSVSAIARHKTLIDEKLKEGFQVTEFTEALENTTDVYDKAKWHFGGDFPDDLDDFQGYVHTGMFLGWLIDSDLVSDEFKSDHEEEIGAFEKKELTGSQIFERCCDGVLMLEDINELGNKFALHYFDFSKGKYVADYEATLSNDLPTMYHVADTWGNYRKLKVMLDNRFADWKKQKSKKPFWRLW
jgi:hypothetical protein